jgi:spore coat polysaccharide biosynthesis protein SpsF
VRVAVLITARLGSTRLPKKHLLPVSQKPILQFLVDAIRHEFSREILEKRALVSIATSDRPENGEFRERIKGCEVFAGSDDNIPLRHLQAADAYGAEAILSVDGDDIVCSPKAMRAVYSELCGGALFVKTEGLPLGMNASGYSTSLLRKALANFGSEGALETGWGRVFSGIAPKIISIPCVAPEGLRFTLDYQEDYRFFKELFADPLVSSGAADENAIIDIVVSRGLDKITRPIADEYWKNFYSSMENEVRRNHK